MPMQGSNSILAGLTNVAILFVAKLKFKISSNRLPFAISNAIYIGSAQSSENSSSIEVKIDLKEAPMAAAFEWGSGIHRTRGTPGKYPIVPRNASMLAIPRSRWPNYQPPPDVDPVILPKVNHPGIAARPYIVPTLEDKSFQNDARKILGQSFKEQVLLGIERKTVIEIHVT